MFMRMKQKRYFIDFNEVFLIKFLLSEDCANYT